MDVQEYTKAYGSTAAARAFGITDHCVITVTPGHRVVGVCGDWRASMPLGLGQDVDEAIKYIEDALSPFNVTFEYIRNDPS